MRQQIGTAWLSDDYYYFHLKFSKDWAKQHITDQRKQNDNNEILFESGRYKKYN